MDQFLQFFHFYLGEKFLNKCSYSKNFSSGIKLENKIELRLCHVYSGLSDLLFTVSILLNSKASMVPDHHWFYYLLLNSKGASAYKLRRQV